MKKLTIIIPFLNEAENLKFFDERIQDFVKNLKDADVEFLFIDDGSTDDSLNVLKTIKYKKVKIISFSKNYGSHYAILAGIDSSDADFITFMSADMQEPVQLYVDMLNKMNSGSSEILFGTRRIVALKGFNRLFSKFYNYLVKNLAFHDFPENGTDIFMISKKVADAIRSIPENNTSVYGLLFSVGFKKEFVPYDQTERKIGTSKWTLKKKIKLFTDTFVAFSIFPLRLITITGVIVSLSGFAFGLAIIVYYLMGWIKTPGYSTIVALITFGFGSVFLMLGIISEYLWRMFDQIRPRPRYIIREKFGFDDSQDKH